MGAPDLLENLRAAGLRVALSDDKIVVSPRDKLTDHLRRTIKANRAELLRALTPDRRDRNPLMTAEQEDLCHAGTWDEAEVSTFTRRVMLFIQRGVGADAADNLAERLTLRDREQDDRHVCAECDELSRDGHCQAAKRGAMRGADLRLEPVQTLLLRCPAFALRKALA